MRDLVLWLGILSGALAAGLWLYASKQRVPFRNEKQQTGTYPLAMVDVDDEGNKIDILKTAERQTFWNGWAAGAASIAAICQALSPLL